MEIYDSLTAPPVYKIYYDYDKLYQLTSEKRLDSSGQAVYKYIWQYDDAGNRLMQEKYDSNNALESETAYAYNAANQLITEDFMNYQTGVSYTKTYAYDGAGNRVSKSEPNALWDYSYDYENHLISVNKNSNPIATYTFNILGNRVRKYLAENSEWLAYLYDGASCIADYTSSDSESYNLRNYYISGNRSLLLLNHALEPNYPADYYYTFDSSNSVRELIDTNKNVQNHYDYEAFGVPLNWNETIQQHFTYFSSQFDTETENFYDNENVKIFASASQAGLLKDQRALLTGRTRLYEILPLRFDEFLSFKNITIKKSESYLKEQYFIEYMKTGGIPEYVLTGDIEYLEELCDNLLYKDIIATYGIKDAGLVRDYFKLLMERSGKQASVSKMANVLGISPDTSRRYFGYFQNSYIIHTIERCGKLNERIRSGKKVYAGDVGIRNMVTGFRDKGAVFENLVYFKMKKFKPCYVYQNGIEIDFKTDNFLIEAKYNSEMTEKQKHLFEQISSEKKIVVDSVESFLNLV